MSKFSLSLPSYSCKTLFIRSLKREGREERGRGRIHRQARKPRKSMVFLLASSVQDTHLILVPFSSSSSSSFGHNTRSRKFFRVRGHFPLLLRYQERENGSLGSAISISSVYVCIQSRLIYASSFLLWYVKTTTTIWRHTHFLLLLFAPSERNAGGGWGQTLTKY